MKTMAALARAALLVSLGWGAVMASDLPERKAGGLQPASRDGGDASGEARRPEGSGFQGGGGGGLEDADEDLQQLLQEVETGDAKESPAGDEASGEAAEAPVEKPAPPEGQGAKKKGSAKKKAAGNVKAAPVDKSAPAPKKKAPAAAPKAAKPKPRSPRGTGGDAQATTQDIFRELGLTKEARL